MSDPINLAHMAALLTTLQNDLAAATATLSVCHETIFNTDMQICVLLGRVRGSHGRGTGRVDVDRLVDSIEHLRHCRRTLVVLLQREGRRVLDVRVRIEDVRGEIEGLNRRIAGGSAEEGNGREEESENGQMSGESAGEQEAKVEDGE